jgi:hypothetical protein
MSDRLTAATAELVAALREELRADIQVAADGPDRLLSIEQARQAMGGISRSTLYTQMAAGRVRTLKIGRRRLVPSSAIAELTLGDDQRRAPTSGQKVSAREVRRASANTTSAA